jgi:hypothetical protein
VWLFACLLVAGCSGVSSVPYDARYMGLATTVGTPYVLPRGLVPVEVFVDENGVAISIDQPELVSDNRVGILVAKTKPSIFNDEKMTIGVDTATGFLNSVSSESVAKIQAIVEEAAKLAGRLSLQNAKLAFFANKTKFMSDRLDPLDPDDVERVSRNINFAIARAAGGEAGLPDVRLSVDGAESRMLQGGAPTAPSISATLPSCQMGICVRAMTSHTIRVMVDGTSVDSKTVKLPSREIIAVPVPQIILADQTIKIEIKDGIVGSYFIDRKSEAYGLVQTVAAIPGAFVQGALSGFGDKKSLADKEKEAIDAQKELKDAKEAAAKSTSVTLQNAAFPKSNPYQASILTVYPLRSTLMKSVNQQRIRREAAPPTPPSSPQEDMFLEPKK